MSKKTLLYRNVNSELLNSMLVEINNLKFFNKEDGPISYIKENENIILRDENGIWTPNKYLKVVGNIIINNVKCCFEDEKNRIALKTTDIGVALKITINNSLCETMQLGYFDCNANKVDIKFEKVFEDEELLKYVRFEFILYLKDTKEHESTDLSIANEKGMIFGIIAYLYVVIDGNGSELPIYFVKNTKHDPLWKLEFEYDNVLLDRFDESYCLKINIEHEGFQYLVNPKDNINFNRVLLNEIIAETLLIVLNEVNSRDGFEFGDTFEDGSVAEFVKYLHDVVLDNPSSLENQKEISFRLRKQYSMR